jgi:hypothetical protein
MFSEGNLPGIELIAQVLTDTSLRPKCGQKKAIKQEGISVQKNAETSEQLSEVGIHL